jgi:hypothetical protein
MLSGTRVGTRNHCLHGKKGGVVKDILDWRPFEYQTVQMVFHGITIIETSHLEPLPDGGTRLTILMDGATPLPGFLRRPALKLMTSKIYSKVLGKLKELITEEQAQSDTALAGLQAETIAPVVAASHA